MEAPAPDSITRARPRGNDARAALTVERATAPSTPRQIDPAALAPDDSRAAEVQVQGVERKTEPILKPAIDAAAVGTISPSSRSAALKARHLRDPTRKPVARVRTRAGTEMAALHQSATGTLRINSLPWAEIYLDGSFVGTTPQANLLLGAGRHRVKLVNQPMEMSKTFVVEIQSGKVVTKSMNLSL
jgi:hypothetical protein